MSVQGARRSQLDALLALYRIWDVRYLDPTTVVASWPVSEVQIRPSFEQCARQGYLREVSDDLYELTDLGERKIRALILRRSKAGRTGSEARMTTAGGSH